MLRSERYAHGFSSTGTRLPSALNGSLSVPKIHCILRCIPYGHSVHLGPLSLLHPAERPHLLSSAVITNRISKALLVLFSFSCCVVNFRMHHTPHCCSPMLRNFRLLHRPPCRYFLISEARRLCQAICHQVPYVVPRHVYNGSKRVASHCSVSYSHQYTPYHYHPTLLQTPPQCLQHHRPSSSPCSFSSSPYS